MVKSTHIAAGLAFAVICSCSAPETILVCVGSVLPDIDTKASFLGKKVPFLSGFLKHRTFTHSLVFCALSALVSPYLFLGVLSHIIMDMCNPKGVQLFFPLWDNIRFPIINHLFITGSKAEKILRYLLYIVTGIYVVSMINPVWHIQIEDIHALWDNAVSNTAQIIDAVSAFFS